MRIAPVGARGSRDALAEGVAAAAVAAAAADKAGRVLLFLAARMDCLFPAPALEIRNFDLKNPFGMDISWLYFNGQ